MVDSEGEYYPQSTGIWCPCDWPTVFDRWCLYRLRRLNVGPNLLSEYDSCQLTASGRRYRYEPRRGAGQHSVLPAPARKNQ